MSDLPTVFIGLLVEVSLLFLGGAIFFAFRYKGLARKIRDYLARRAAFEQVLEKTAKDLAQHIGDSIKSRVAQGDMGEETARLLEESRVNVVEGALQSFRAAKGEQKGFWDGVNSRFLDAMLGMAGRIEELLAKGTVAEEDNLDPADDQIAADDEVAEAPDLNIMEDASGEAVIESGGAVIVHDDQEEIDNLRRVIRFQTRKIDELVDFRRRFDDLQVNFHNIRAVNTRLKQQLYDLLWKKDDSSDNSEDLERVMAEFERSNQELKLCVDTLESENTRLKGAVEGIGDQQERHVAQVGELAATGDEELAERVSGLELDLDKATTERDALQEELRVLQREYVSLYAQQQARAQGL